MNTLARKQSLSPRSLCLNLYKNHSDKDRETAIAECVREAKKDKKILDAALYLAFLAVSQYASHQLRSNLIEAVPDDLSGMLTTIDKNARTLYDYPLPGGVKLGDATQAQLDLGIEEYARQSRGMLSNSVWLKSVRKAMGKHEHVRDGVTLKIIATLRKKAEEQATKVVG